MNNLTETDAPDIAVDRAGFHAAMEALTMDDEHPRGRLSGSPMSRLGRALYAYEWAKREHPVTVMPDGSWRQDLPKLGTARAAVLAKEARDE